MTSLNFVTTGPAFCHLPSAYIGDVGIGPFLIPISGMAFALGVIIVGVLEKAQKERLRHETIQRALEKGQQLPPELLEGKPLRRARDDRRGGLIAIAVGIGLFVFFGAMRADGIPDGLKWLGLIPGLVGVALLINWALERGEKNGEPKP
jgi:hypothetical protein